ncbi:MAG: class I SAM-dependent methyltransferase, partial [SAR202 cluster bacterium]|nr:class I SAM-dependent methyltransferase [SAR202 cluster bacterium]
MKLNSRDSCRICGSKNLTSILNLGDQYFANYSPKSNDVVPFQEKIPLELVRCDKSIDPKSCGLVQLRHTTPPNLMYDRYFYRSGINQTMTNNLNEIAKQAISKIKLNPNDIVIDIGCNDGTLLQNYKELPIRSVGFDPAKNMVQFSKQTGATIITEFFSAEEFIKNYGSEKAKIITSIAMFYDLEDPNQFVDDISKILHPDGIWILELSYLPLMLSQNAFDTIVHEHLEYYHLDALEFLLSKFNLKVVDIQLNDINGGSFRVVVQHKDKSLDNKSREYITKLQEKEKNLNLSRNQPFDDFITKINNEKDKLITFIKNEVSAGKTVHGYGASTKGNTLLQFYNLDKKLIQFIADRNPDKWGRRTIGTDISIISEEESHSMNPDYFLILPWHFIKEFKERETNYLK